MASAVNVLIEGSLWRGQDYSPKDPETDYVSDVFVGPRPKQLERSIAIDYTRHGIELETPV